MSASGGGFASFNISTREMTSGLNSPPCKGANISVGKVVASNNTALQQGSPRPSLLASTIFSYSEVLGGLSASSGYRNALLFEFPSSIQAFGAWFGDVESRTSAMGDARAFVRLFDASGNRIGNDFVIEETDPSWANQRTRWIGFVSSTANVKSMLVVVGDDDGFVPFAPLARLGKFDPFSPSVTNGAGFSEHLSFIGGTILLSPTGAPAEISGRVTDENGRGISRARVNVLDSTTGVNRSVLTNGFGYYRLEGLETGDLYIVSASHKSYTFENNQRAVQLISDNDTINFVGRER
jgi:hypothetical protein